MVGQHLTPSSSPPCHPLTNWIFLFAVLGCPSVPLFEKYIIQDPKAFYVLTGIVFDHNFNDSTESLPLEVRASLPSESSCDARLQCEFSKQSRCRAAPRQLCRLVAVLHPEEMRHYS